jgi:hypothetical protein
MRNDHNVGFSLFGVSMAAIKFEPSRASNKLITRPGNGARSWRAQVCHCIRAGAISVKLIRWRGEWCLHAQRRFHSLTPDEAGRSSTLSTARQGSTKAIAYVWNSFCEWLRAGSFPRT